MLTVSRNDSDLFDSLRAGAAGYLLKDTDPERLPDALRGVIAGEAAVPRALVARLIDEFRSRGTRRRLPLIGGRGVELTSREWEVLDLMAEGLTTAQIVGAAIRLAGDGAPPHLWCDGEAGRAGQGDGGAAVPGVGRTAIAVAAETRSLRSAPGCRGAADRSKRVSRRR